jgi:TFIIF-interacting CTD phosphatase-like protein
VLFRSTGEVGSYRQWLASVISEAERLYKIQTQSLDQAESAIQQSRARLQSSFERLEQLQDQVLQNLNADDTIINRGPIRVASERTKVAIDAPKKTKSAGRKPAKKAAAKKPVKKAAAKRK